MDVLIFYLVFNSWRILNLGTSYGKEIYNPGFNYGSHDQVKIDPDTREIEIISRDNVNNPGYVSTLESWHDPKFHGPVNIDSNKRESDILLKDSVINPPDSVTKPTKLYMYNPKFHEQMKVHSNKRQIEILSKDIVNNPASGSTLESWHDPKFHLVKIDPNTKQIEIRSNDIVINRPASVTKPRNLYNPKFHELVKIDPNSRQIDIISRDIVNNPASVSTLESWHDSKFHDLVNIDSNKRQSDIIFKDGAINPPASVTKSTKVYNPKFHDLIKVDSNKRQIEIISKNMNNPPGSVKTPIEWLNPKGIVPKYNVVPTIPSNLNVYKPKGLSMNVGKHLVKVESHSYPKQPDEKYSETLPNSKYHAIEIIPNDKEIEQTTDDLNLQYADATESNESGNTGSKSSASSIHLDELTDITELNSNEVTIAARAGNEATESLSADELQGSGEDEFDSKDFGKSGRILGVFSRRNETAPVCTTPKNETGRCRRFRNCLLSDALNNFNVFLQYLCLVRGAVVGMCCPDNPVIEIVNPDENSTESDTGKDIKQPPEGCGLNTKTRIVGGTISLPHEWSWMVTLMRRNRFYCGGVIINNWYVLTAAHCVLGIEVKDLTVRLGEYNFSTNNEHKEDISVAEIKRHAQFVTLTFQHDIALLKLRRSIRYTKFVGSICLPTLTSRDYSNVSGTVVGWGTVSFGGAASPVLRQVTIPIWNNEDCDKTYVLENISDSFLCAGSPEKAEDACQGDSGGPLMTLNDRMRWEVIGIVSWGRRCGDPIYPGVYTRITTYLDWITQNAT